MKVKQARESNLTLKSRDCLQNSQHAHIAFQQTTRPPISLLFFLPYLLRAILPFFSAFLRLIGQSPDIER